MTKRMCFAGGFLLPVAALPLFITALCEPASAADWPMYRADAARSGYTAEPLPSQLSLRWVYRAPHAPRPAWQTSSRLQFDFASQPIVMGQTVLFASSADDKVYALDLQTGAPRWTFFTGGPVRFAPAGWQDRVFVASDDGYLYALKLADGSLIWKHRGGPGDDMILGNERMISHWPARGGPVVIDDTVYFAAGIWPSDGVYLHALEAATGQVKWTNDHSGRIYMPQPHGNADANSGVSAQGYLVAGPQHLFVPTGRAVPAAFQRADGQLAYYHLQANQHRGGWQALLADGFLCNAGCLFDVETGELANQLGLGALVATPQGIVRAEGRSLTAYRWINAQKRDRKGELVSYRTPEQHRLVSQQREVVELIVAGEDAVCGEDGRVSAVDYTQQQTTWWSHDVEGAALGLAAAGGRLIVSTDRGVIYCFDGAPGGAAPSLLGDQEESLPAEATHTVDYAKAAAEIIAKTGVTEGICLDLGCGTGELSLELARQTNLQICAVEPDPAKVAVARKRLDEAGLYGVRVAVIQAEVTRPPLPKYFANLVVSCQSLAEPPHQAAAEQMRRVQRPYGGQKCLGPAGKMIVHTRGPLEGAGSWTHQNSDTANTLCSMDRLVKGPLQMFWFRDVDFEIPNRHGQGPAPLVHRGYLVVGGVDGLCALDAYNGRTLWMYWLKGNLKAYDGIHHDVGVGETGSNFCLSDDSVFIKTDDRCLRLDLSTGKQRQEFKTPTQDGNSNRAWGYLAYSDGLLYGTVANQQHTVSPRYASSKLYSESVGFFAMDANTGQVKWQYQPKHSIRNNAIAIADGTVYLIDRPLAAADHVAEPRRGGKHLPPLKSGEHPGGTLLALDAATGAVRWQQQADIFGTQLAVSPEHGVLLMYFQAVRHNFFKLPSEIGGRIAGFDAVTGQRLWDRQADYKTRPLINGDCIYSQGGAWLLKTGSPVPFELNRSYGCGQISSSESLMLFRSATLGYLDLSRDAGVENFGGMRPGCWLNAIPAGGLVLVPEGSSKCRCSYQMRAWFALEQQE